MNEKNLPIKKESVFKTEEVIVDMYHYMYNVHVMMNTNNRNLFAIFSLGQEDIAYIFDICIIGGL